MVFKLQVVLLQLMCVQFTYTMPNIEYIEDENAEIAVPRSPRIQGPSVVHMDLPSGQRLDNLTCEIEGIPTPKVIWIKDHVGIQSPLQDHFDADKMMSILYFPLPLSARQGSTKSNVTGASTNVTMKNSTDDGSYNTNIYSFTSNSPVNRTYGNWNGSWEGNYTCVAANFLGRGTKSYIITFSKKVSSDIPDTTPVDTLDEQTTEDIMTTTLIYEEIEQEDMEVDTTTTAPHEYQSHRKMLQYDEQIPLHPHLQLINGTLAPISPIRLPPATPETSVIIASKAATASTPDNTSSSGNFTATEDMSRTNTSTIPTVTTSSANTFNETTTSSPIPSTPAVLMKKGSVSNETQDSEVHTPGNSTIITTVTSSEPPPTKNLTDSFEKAENKTVNLKTSQSVERTASITTLNRTYSSATVTKKSQTDSKDTHAETNEKNISDDRHLNNTSLGITSAPRISENATRLARGIVYGFN